MLDFFFNGGVEYGVTVKFFITPDGYDTDAALLEGYAREHRMAVLMANYGAATSEWRSAGRSAIWSHTGRLLTRGPAEGEAVVVARYQRDA